MVLDTQEGGNIHLFSVFEEINPDMQDSERKDRHARAHHYKMTTGLGDVQIHIEHLQERSFAEIENDLSAFLVADNNELQTINESFVKEPNGTDESLVLDAGEGGASTLKYVLPKRRGSVLVRAYVDYERKTLDFIKRDERLIRHLSDITEKVLGFDLTKYSEHIGNCYFVECSSPLKDIDVTATTDPSGLLCTVEYRNENWTEDFTIQVRDRHHGGVIVTDKLFEIKGGTKLVMLDLPQVAKEVEIYVYNKRHQILYYHPYTPFVRSINIDMGVQSKVLHVKGKDAYGIEQSKKYPKYSHQKTIISTEGKQIYADGIFRDAKPLLLNDNGDEGLIFRFFDADADHKDDSVVKARKVLQDIINLAKTECYICDPYFNANDFQNFIYPISSLNVNVKILNGREQMRKKLEGDEKEEDRILSLKKVLTEYNEKVSGQPVQCKLLKGRGQLHDRFILIDDRGWILGASFSEFGNRVTTINQIPVPYLNGIKKRVATWWNSSTDTLNIEEYVANNNARGDTSSPSE